MVYENRNNKQRTNQSLHTATPCTLHHIIIIMSNQHPHQQQYPFSGNANAQLYSSDGGHGQYDYAPQPRHPPSTFEHDDDEDAAHAHTQRNTYHDSYDEKATRGATPGLASNNMYGRSNSNSIWTPEDKHVFFKRSVPARIARSVFCILLWTVIVVISVILLVVTFAKPPNVAVMSISVPDSSDFSVSGTSFKANGSVNFAISNPNSFSATIEHLQAHLYDANLGKSVSVGNGTLQSQKIKANDNTTISFPFDIGIDLASDASALISDVATQCGLSDLVSSLTTSSSRRATNQLKVLLEVDAKISVLSVGVSIPVSKNISIDCPTSALQSVLGSLTGSSGSSSISSILGGRDVAVDVPPISREIMTQVLLPWFPRSGAVSQEL